ncbi:MAG: hypothetical protein WC436_02185 [Candidatus Babeliales bacterium]
MRKIIFLIYLFFIFFNFNVKCYKNAPENPDSAAASSEEDFFEKFFKELLKETEEQGLDESLTPTGQPLLPSKIQQKPFEPEEKAQPIITEKKLTKEEYFLQSPQETPSVTKEKGLQDKKKGVKTPKTTETLVKKLSKERKEAFNFYINKFEDSLKKLESKIDSLFTLDILFKEDLEKINYKKIINSIKKELGQITSKSTLRKAFFLPSQTETRKNIFNAIKELDKIGLQIIKQEKKTEEEIEEDIIKELERLSEKKPLKKSFTFDKNLQTSIKKLISQNLKKIQENLEKISTIPVVKKELEAKKKEKEKLEAQAAKRLKEKYTPAYQQPKYYPGHKRPEYPYGGYDSFPSSYYPSQYPSYTEKPETKPSTITPTETTKEDSEKKDRKYIEKEKDTIQKIKNLIDSNIKLLSEVLTDSAKDNDLDKILSQKKLSKIVKNLQKIEVLNDKFSKTEQENISKSHGYNQETFDDLLKKFIPLGVKLAKNLIPKKEEEIHAILSLLEKEPELRDKEVAKYEEELLKSLDREIVENGSPEEKQKLFRDLQILIKTEPASEYIFKNLREKEFDPDSDAIQKFFREQKREKAKQSSDSEKFRKLLYSEEQQPELKPEAESIETQEQVPLAPFEWGPGHRLGRP